MKIDLFIPPAVASPSEAAGYLIRCKPENDCASLFGPDTTTAMYRALHAATTDAIEHDRVCPHEHAVVVIARGPVAMAGEGANPPGEDGGASREPGNPVTATPRQMVRIDGAPKIVHDEIYSCAGLCRPVDA